MGEQADRPYGGAVRFIWLLHLPDARAGMCVRGLETGPARMGAVPANIAQLYAVKKRAGAAA